MRQFTVLNSREAKKILALIKIQWDADFKTEHSFLLNKQDLYLITREIAGLDFEKLRINSPGLYFGEIKNDSIRLSIEGSQLVGKLASKNIIDLDDEEAKQWLSGATLDKQSGCRGYVLIRHNDDFMGTGCAKDGKILNFVPKGRRISGW